MAIVPSLLEQGRARVFTHDRSDRYPSIVRTLLATVGFLLVKKLPWLGCV
jgi:hypothetical protein